MVKTITMWKTYKYIYYWLYTWNKSLWGENDVPQFNAVAGMSLSFGCNILSIVVLFDILFGIKIFPNGVPQNQAIFFVAGVLIGHYFTFMHKGKFRRIEKEFKKESKAERKRKGRWVLLYAFGSLAFYIFLLFFGIWVKH